MLLFPAFLFSVHSFLLSLFIFFPDGPFKRQKHVIRCKELLTLFHLFSICIITVKPHWKAWGLVITKIVLGFISKGEKILNLLLRKIGYQLCVICYKTNQMPLHTQKRKKLSSNESNQFLAIWKVVSLVLTCIYFIPRTFTANKPGNVLLCI